MTLIWPWTRKSYVIPDQSLKFDGTGIHAVTLTILHKLVWFIYFLIHRAPSFTAGAGPCVCLTHTSGRSTPTSSGTSRPADPYLDKSEHMEDSEMEYFCYND